MATEERRGRSDSGDNREVGTGTMREEGGETVVESICGQPSIKPKGEAHTIMDGAAGKRPVEWETVGDDFIDEVGWRGGVTKISTAMVPVPSFPGELLALVEFVVNNESQMSP